MAEFALFPTACWAKKTSQTTAVVWEKGHSAYLSALPRHISWQNWHLLVLSTITHLSLSPNQTFAYAGNHRLIGLLCYCAVLASGGRILILNSAMPESQQAEQITQLQIHRVIRDEDFANFSPKTIACSKEGLADFNSHAPATITLTSGSSGSPKAIVHSMHNHLSNARGVCELVGFESKNAWLLSLPLFHVSGQGIVWRWLYRGACLLVNEDKKDFWPLLQAASHASLVPTQLQRYLEQPLRASHQQHFLLGGSHIPQGLIEQARTQGIQTYAGYGMTEMASTICAVKNESDNVGRPLLQRKVKIVSNEIWVRGESLALGYWQDNVIKPLTNREGWLATKDRGEWNSHGQLVVKGRLDNMFISGGENIQPEAVEKQLYQSDLLESVFIVPVEDNEFSQRPVAFVQFKAITSPLSFVQAVEKLRKYASLELEKFRQPIAYFSLEQIAQKTRGIKISRKQLQEYANRLCENKHHV